MSDRDFDVVVFGATSVTGRRVASYLASRMGEADFRWAAGARDAGRAREVLAEEGVVAPDTVIADVGDPQSLAEMAGRARVVLNLVGPYTLHGTPVIEACVAAGTHYADLTGEIPLVRRVIAEFDDRAREAGMKLVQVCGFEALPPDLAVALLAEAAAQRDDHLAEVDLTVAMTGGPPMPPRPSDFISGGTLQSLAAATGDPDSAVIVDSACLVSDKEMADAIRRTSPIAVAPRRGPGGEVVAPMAPAAFINPSVIQRSAALRATATGEPLQPFAYREGIAIRGGTATLPLRYAIAGALAGTQAAIGRLAQTGTGVRARASRVMSKVFPGSGAGPAADRLEAWRWRMDLRAVTGGGSELRLGVDADGHPGYLATARMLGEAGLLMAEDGPAPDDAGCLTPSVALGTERIERFDRAGLRFEPVA